MRSKQEILERTKELRDEAGDAAHKAYEDAYRHARAKQGAERLQLQKECDDSGGHVFVDAFGMTPDCAICGAKKQDPSEQIAHNVTVFC